MIEPKKSLGQNFLTDKGVLSSFLETSSPTLDEVVLEIGPGEGVLTEQLLLLSEKVISVEKDHRIIPILEEK